MTGATQGKLPPGKRIIGKWSQGEWTVHSCLGVGANGAVYSVVDIKGRVSAMKVCETAGSVAFEWDLLQQMSKHTKAFPQPVQIDDSASGEALYFYVMEQVSGQPLSAVWAKSSATDKQRILAAIGQGLRELHLSSHAFCDVKAENMLVSLHQEPCVRFVDVGGVTSFGRSVRQFTPTSDAAYWGHGERRSSARYDLAAVGLTLLGLEVQLPNNLAEMSVTKRQAWMKQALRKISSQPFSNLLEEVIVGKVNTADMWLQRVQNLQFDRTVRSTQHHATSANQRRAGKRASASAATGSRPRNHRMKSRGKQSSQRSDWTERFMWVSLTCAFLSTAGAWIAYFQS